MRAHLTFARREWRHIAVGSLLVAGGMTGLMLLGSLIA